MAKALAQSIKKHIPDSKMVVCLVEKHHPDSVEGLDLFDEVVLAKDMGFLHFEQTIFKYSRYETAGFCKGQLFQFLFQKYPSQDHIVYLDADTQVFGPLREVDEALRSHSIVLTPHLLYPLHDFTYLYGEFALLNSGNFNTGFLALKRSSESQVFLDWWCDRLNHYCYTDPPRGLFNEQKWMDLVPIFFDKVKNLKHPGYNVAYWNLFERNITKTSDNYKANDQPLRFFHFSGLPYITDTLNLINNETTVQGMKLLNEYQRSLEEHGHQYLSNMPWSYDYFDNGRLISDKIRNFYKNNYLVQSEIINPFSASRHVFKKYRG
ncbi:glycosyltransferase [Fictibacillus sp. NRS-1165]|uniref:glycosyltransferase n=1 Tax=Fictibacillus sp. NRS-1165 TaxID=3144463 RepID=UPI003D1DBB31